MHIQEALAREDELQRRISNLEAQIDSLRQQDHDSTIRDLQEQKEELEMRLREQEKLAIATEDARKELTELRQHHAGSISELQERLSQSERHLEELQIPYKSAEVDHENVLKDATLLTKDLERQLEATMSDMQNLQERQAQFHFSEQEQLKKIDDLEKALQKVSQGHEDVLHAHEDERTRLEEELERLQAEKERHLADLRDEHLAAQQELKKEMQSLQDKLEENIRLLDTAEEEAAQLVDRLREETEGRVSDQREYGVELRSAKEQTDTLEGRLREVDCELLGVQSRLQQVEDQVEAAETEKTILRQDMTTLEAEIQKLKSINRYIDAQGKERQVSQMMSTSVRLSTMMQRA
jgi:myosin protein heavy chain